MAKKVLDLQWPLLGVDRSKPYRKQPPFSTPDCRNVRPTDVIEGRSRGGSRPGITKWSYTQMGSGAPVRMLNTVTAIKSDGYKVVSDGFDGTTIGAEWTAIGTAPTIINDAYAYVAAGSSVGAYHTALSGLDTSKLYTIAIYIVPYAGGFGGDYILYSHGANAGPTFASNGFIATLSLAANGAYSGTLKRYSAGSLTNTYTFSTGTSLQPGWFELNITTSGTANITARWQGAPILNQNITVPASGGQMVGFGMNATVAGSRCLVDSFEARYYETTSPALATRRQVVCAASNGSMYYDVYGTMTAAGGSLTLSSDRYLDSAERAQCLFIADNGEKIISGTGGANTTTSFDDAAVSDWTTAGISANDHVLVITSGTGASAGIYEISTVAAGSLTLSTSPGATGSGISYYITRCPKVWTSGTANLTRLVSTAGKGQTPDMCPLICLYRDRLVFAGSPDYPHIAYASRVSDPYDYDYSADSTDPARAWYLGMSEREGTVGHPITALICGSDDQLIFGCTDRIMVLRGDVTYDGQLDLISSSVGVLGGGKAWCFSPTGELFVMSKLGLYMIPPGMNAILPVSSEVLPRELKSIDTTQTAVLMHYDVDAGGIHIWLTPRSGGQTPEHWFFAHKSGGGFWPFTTQSNLEAFSICGPDPVTGSVIWGSRNGFIRMFSDVCETDEGSEISSHLVYGPIKTANNDYKTGLLTELVGVLASGSGEVDWEVRVSDTCEGAADSTTAFDSGTWDEDGLQFKQRPRARGGAFCVRLSNGSTEAWSVDSLMAVVEPLGAQRKA